MFAPVHRISANSTNSTRKLRDTSLSFGPVMLVSELMAMS
jgi:hypothetical protein